MKNSDERPLPANIGAERLVLGVALVEESLVCAMLDALEESDFALEAHRMMFRAMAAMYQAGTPIDGVTVAAKLTELGLLEAVGGFSYLASLDDGLPRIPHIDAYLKAIRDKATLRRAIHAHTVAIDDCYAGGDTAELLARAERAISEVSGRISENGEFQTPLSVVEEHGLSGYLDRRRVDGVPTHVPALNALTRGLQPGDLAILAARTSVGKTAFAINTAMSVARTGQGVLFFSLEMNEMELMDRMICIEGYLTFQKLFHAADETERRDVRRAVDSVTKMPIHIRAKSITVPSIHAKTRRMQSRHPIGLVVVDYLQLVSSAVKTQNRAQEVSAISRGLKQAASDLGVPVLALSQLSRPEKGVVREPTLSDLKESGDIENDANMVIFLHPLEDYVTVPQNAPLRVKGILAKQRNGPLGVFDLAFHRQYGRIEQEYGGASGG